MQLLKTIVALALAAATISATPLPSPQGQGQDGDKDCDVQEPKECPYDDFYVCAGPRREACYRSGIEVCEGPSFGGPPEPCFTYCRDTAWAECEELGCSRPNS